MVDGGSVRGLIGQMTEKIQEATSENIPLFERLSCLPTCEPREHTPASSLCPPRESKDLHLPIDGRAILDDSLPPRLLQGGVLDLGHR